MSKYGGSEKTTQAFVAAYNKPRLLSHSSQAEATVCVVLFLGTIPLPQFALSSLASSSPGVMWVWVSWEGNPQWVFHRTLITTLAPL